MKICSTKSKIDLPNIDLPNIDLPNIDLPNIDLPNIDLPNIDLPNINLPNINLSLYNMKTKETNKTRKIKYILSNLEKIKKVSKPFEKELEKKIGEKLLLANVQKDIIDDLQRASRPGKYLPEDDFYSFINDKWVREITTTEKQKYITQIDDFRLVQDKVYHELLGIVKEYIKTQSKLSVIMNNYYKSQVRGNTDNELRYRARESLHDIDSLLGEKKNIWKMLAMLNKNEIVSQSCPFALNLYPDDKQVDIFRCFINSPYTFSILDINVYFNDSDTKYKQNYKNHFFKYLENLFSHAFGKNHGFNVKDIFEVERKIIEATGCFFIKDDDIQSYNRVYTKDALEIYGFDWDQFSKELGFHRPPDFFITGNLDYLKCGTKLLKEEWNTASWRTYWIYCFIRQQAKWNRLGRENAYDFYGNFEKGQEKPMSSELQNVFSMSFAFNTFLTTSYIDKYANDRNIDYVKAMSEDLKTVFIRIIKKNKWLNPKGKEVAIKKLEKCQVIIGSPKILREDPLLDYSSTDAWGNILKINDWRCRQFISLEGDKIVDVPLIDWVNYPFKFMNTQAYIVNAYYTPAKNNIYIPLAYLQKPFIDLDERGVEYNLAFIGFTIAHELSHALDDEGRKYDENGILNNWWTPKDLETYNKIQKDIIKQYETVALRDGIEFDASIGIGEDLADISGLNICINYLRDFQLKNNDVLPIKALSFEAFFVYFAYQMKQKIEKKSLSSELKTNPHPLDKYRTNIPLSRIPAFRTIFSVKKGDKMYWHSTNRIWED